jgi:hypothetical protein
MPSWLDPRPPPWRWVDRTGRVHGATPPPLQKFYAVRKGRTVGIFRTWAECKKQVDGVTSEFKSFVTEAEARIYLAEGTRTVAPKPLKAKRHRRPGQSDAEYLQEQKALLAIAQAKLEREQLEKFWGNAPPGPVCYMMVHAPHDDRGSRTTASSFQGGRALRAVAVVQMGTKTRSTAAAIDTMSDVTLALAKYLTDIRPIKKDTVHGMSGAVVFNQEGTLSIQVAGRTVKVPALVCTQRHLPQRCQLLLGVPAIIELDLELSAHLRLQDQPLVCHLREKR